MAETASNLEKGAQRMLAHLTTAPPSTAEWREIVDGRLDKLDESIEKIGDKLSRVLHFLESNNGVGAGGAVGADRGDAEGDEAPTRLKEIPF